MIVKVTIVLVPKLDTNQETREVTDAVPVLEQRIVITTATKTRNVAVTFAILQEAEAFVREL